MKRLALISIATILGMTISQNIPSKESKNFLSTGNITTDHIPYLKPTSDPLIGGGLHDIIKAQSLKTLERWALTAEAHVNKITGKTLIGGLHGRGYTLSKEDYAQYVLDIANEFPDLNSAKELDRLSLAYGIVTEKEYPKTPLIGGGLHDIIRNKDINTLKTWAFTVEAHHKTTSGKEIFGGIHGRKEPMTKEEYIEYILSMVENYPELNNPTELDRLSVFYDVAKPSMLQFGGLHDFLFKQEKDILEKWALTAEYHHKTKSGIEILGGIHGRRDPLSKEEYIEYIMDMAKIYPDLDSPSKLDKLSVAYGIQLPEHVFQMGGLHDYIFNESYETLEKWAKTIEAHDSKVIGKTILGGIYGRRDPLTKEEYAHYILDMIKIYPGLNSKNELERLSVVYGFSNPQLSSEGGLHDFLFRQSSETLLRWALTTEKYYKEKTGKNILGGLHGRLIPLSNQEYAEYILHKVAQYPELDNAQELDRLSQVYGFADSPKLLKNFGGLGGLHDYIFRTDRETLKKWAFTCEAHQEKVKGVHLLGGLHDYIDSLSNEQIAEYVLRMAETYQESNSSGSLNSLAETYGIGKKEFKEALAFLI